MYGRSFISKVLIGIISLGFFSSCSEDVDLNTSGPATNIGYCLLNPDEDVQYVRIGRSYFSSDVNIAPDSDSLIWSKNFQVYIEEWDANQKITDVYYFSPYVKIVKDTGFFPVEGLAIFKSDFKPELSHTYSLYIHFQGDSIITTGVTTIPGNIILRDPKPIPDRKINLQSGSNYSIRWEPAEKAGIYQSFFNITYKETDESGISINDIAFNTTYYLELSPPPIIVKSVSGNRFFNEVINQVDSTKEAVREVINVSFEMFTGGEELALYLSSIFGGNNLSSGFKDYTNLTNGIGVFSSISKHETSNLSLSNTTLDELAYGDKTKHLGFLDHYGKRDE